MQSRISPLSLRFKVTMLVILLKNRSFQVALNRTNQNQIRVLAMARRTELRRVQMKYIFCWVLFINSVSLIAEFLMREWGSERHLCFHFLFLQCLKQGKAWCTRHF